MVSQAKLYSYAAAAIGFVAAAAIFTRGGGIEMVFGGFLAGMGSLLAIGFLRYGYILIPLITSRTQTIIMTDTGYEIPPSQDVIVKKINNTYYASVYMGIRIYESSTEKSFEENVAYNEYFERAISNLKYVTKIAYLLYVEDISEKRKAIETKRAEAQLRLAREREKAESDVLKIDKYEREVGVWDIQLNKLIKGVKPMGVVAYAMTTATGVSKEGAIASAKAQANEIRTLLANSLNVEVEILAADELLRCFEWEKFYPTSIQEVEDIVS